MYNALERSTYKILVRKPEGRGLLLELRRKLEDNAGMDLK
jgi:hypothetical protein